MPRYTTVGGIPITELLSEERIAALSERTANGGAEIVSLLKTGSAYYAPATSAIAMAESYLKGQRRVIACAAYLEGEYGYKDLYMGVPIVIGGEGMEKVVEIELSEGEKKMLETSANAVRELIQASAKL
jgi:malate dehydrogenase